MSIGEAIKHLQYRLSAISTNPRATWSLKDRAAVSALCIEAVEQKHTADGAKSGRIVVSPDIQACMPKSRRR